MSSGQHADDLAAKAAERVRLIIAEAEDRAAEIVSDAEANAGTIREQAEAEARQIRERGEADARGQIEAAKRALDELGGTLVAAASDALPKAEAREPEPDPEPDPEPQPVSPPAGDGNDAAARMIAMKLAVDGKDRSAIEAELNQKFGAADRAALLDDVLSRAAS